MLICQRIGKAATFGNSYIYTEVKNPNRNATFFVIKT